MRARLMVIAGLLSVFPMSVRAVENGIVEYPIGVNTVNPAFMPPPGGTLYLNYLEDYATSRFAGPSGSPAVPGFHVNVVAEVARVLHTWKDGWNGLQFSSGIVQPIVSQSAHVGGLVQRSIEAGDTVLQPLYVTGAIGTVHLMAGWDVWIPDGGYNRRDIANAGVNYWTFALEQAITWLPSPQVEVSANLVTSFRLKNPATNYQSGNDFDLDGVVGYRAWPRLPSLQLGVQGFAYAQWTDDSVAGRVVNGGNRGRVFGFGPQIRYDVNHSAFVVKWQHEFGAQNRPSGERFWFQFAVPL